MKAFGGVEPLQYVSLREFAGIHTEAPFQNNLTNLIAGCGLSLEYAPIIQTRRSISDVTTIDTVSAENPVTIASFNSVICSASNGSFKTLTGSPPYVNVALSNSNEVSMTKFKGNLGSTHLIFSNGTDLKKFNGTTVSNLLAGGYPVTVNGFYITTHKNRLFCTSNRTTTLLFSALNKADDWATANDAGSIEIDDNNDLNITAIESAGDRLLIFRENSFYELIGTGPSNFRIVQVSNEIGALNNRSVVVLNGIVYFAHYSGLYAYTSGSIPQKISTPVDAFFQYDSLDSSSINTIKKNTIVLTDNKFIYYNPVSYSSYQQLYQYSPMNNQWIGFYEKNIQAGTVHNNAFYMARRNQANTEVKLIKLNQRDYSAINNDKWFIYLPLMNGETTLNSMNIRSLHLRLSFSGSFDVYIIGQTKGGYQFGFPFNLQNIYFPTDTTSTITQYAQKVFTSTGNFTDGLTRYPLDRGIKIPIKPNNKYTGVSVIIVGTDQFTLHEIGMELMKFPFNNNSSVGALV